jgi:hypothetical protein
VDVAIWTEFCDRASTEKKVARGFREVSIA